MCTCDDIRILQESGKGLIEYNKEYGWILKWIELSSEPGYTQTHSYGVIIKYCPFCGRAVT